jgi:hypothetical protein
MTKSARFPDSREPRVDSVKEAYAGSIVIPNQKCQLLGESRKYLACLSKLLDGSDAPPGTCQCVNRPKTIYKKKASTYHPPEP